MGERVLLFHLGTCFSMVARTMSLPRMNYPQYHKARKLVRECCNYCDGNCLLLDDGEECVCVQSISYSLLCRWFRAAVLPLDAAPSVELHLCRSPTGPNTVHPVPNGFAAAKRQNDSGKGTGNLRI